jgi:hypothetical protein
MYNFDFRCSAQSCVDAVPHFCCQLQSKCEAEGTSGPIQVIIVEGIQSHVTTEGSQSFLVLSAVWVSWPDTTLHLAYLRIVCGPCPMSVIVNFICTYIYRGLADMDLYLQGLCTSRHGRAFVEEKTCWKAPLHFMAPPSVSQLSMPFIPTGTPNGMCIYRPLSLPRPIHTNDCNCNVRWNVGTVFTPDRVESRRLKLNRGNK